MFYFCYFICLILLCSCGGNSGKDKGNAVNQLITESAPKKNEVKYVNSIQLTSPEKNKIYNFGEEVTVTFENKERFPVDSASIYVNGREVARLGKGVNHHILRLPDDKAGNTVIKVISWHPENKRGSASMNIRLKPSQAPEKYSYEILKVFPHDRKAYTQGLQYRDGYMYEGTGQYGESSIRKIDMKSGNILSVLSIDSQHFGEGITIFNDKIYQLTWRSGKGFIYDLNTFSLESTFSYDSEGWGITTAGNHLIMSNGSNKLYFIAPSGFSPLKEIEVYDHQGEVSQLNELEYVNGLVWANVWLSNRIVAIDPETGVVKAELDMTDLLPAADKALLNDKDDVLNGIAWNPVSRTFYVTGKRWPKLFEIKIRPTDE